MTPPRRQWYDKLADALLGDDELSASATASRYALICQRCFAHNGLVKEDMWEETRAFLSVGCVSNLNHILQSTFVRNVVISIPRHARATLH